MQAPYHWQDRTLVSWALLPVSWLYWGVARFRASRVTPAQLPVPVICVGNNGVGGAGKTPTAIALCRMLQEAGFTPHVISRGYKGRYDGTVRVDPSIHIAVEVGDEPLLIARHAPCWVAKRRLHAAKAAIAEGADVIIMDDGLQNPSIHKDVSILVVDSGYGFGNHFMLPAGPCREPVNVSMQKADMVLIIGENDNPAITSHIPAGTPVFRATLQPDSTVDLKGKRVHAFAGIAHPEKFYKTIERLGAKIALITWFADHHIYQQRDLDRLSRETAEHDALLVTTEKDAVRLPVDFCHQVMVVPVTLSVDNKDGWRTIILEHMKREQGPTA